MNIRPSPDCGDLIGSPDALASVLDAVCDRLLQAMHPHGFWEGRLSSSALATATAVSALALSGDEIDASRIASGVAWLCEHHNADGGWGDTTDSPSNLATTLLAIAALRLAGAAGRAHLLRPDALEKADTYLTGHVSDNPRRQDSARRR
jgi:hypothetical protein